MRRRDIRWGGLLCLATVMACHESPRPSEGARRAQALSSILTLSTAAEFRAGSFEGGVEVEAAGNLLALSPGGVGLGPMSITTALPRALNGHAAVASHGFVYVLGGTEVASTAAVLRAPVGANGQLGAWVTERSLPTARTQLAAVATDGFLVVAGGSDLAEVLVSAIAADGTLGPWQVAGPLPAGRSGHAMVAYRGWVYVLGGGLGATRFSDVQRAEVRPNGILSAWGPLPGLPEAMAGHAAVVHAGKLYVLGGTNAVGNPRAAVHRATLNPDGTFGAWLSQSPLPRARTRLTVVAHRGALVVLGGPDAVAADVWLAQLNGEGAVGLWSVAGVLSNALDSSAAVAADGWLYSLGGTVGAAPTAQVAATQMRGGPAVLSWATGPTLPAPVREHALISHRAFVYLIGGEASGTVLARVSVAPVTSSGLGTFVTTTSLPTARRGAAAVELNNYLFVFGGRTSTGGYLNEVISARINIDGTLGAWSAPTAFPNPRWNHRVALEQNRVFIIGGHDGAPRSDVQSAALGLDGTVGPWSQVGTLPTARSEAEAVADRNRLYVMGGEAVGGLLTEVLSADIGAGGMLGAWTTEPALPFGLAAMRAVTHGGALYLTGGRAVAGNQPVVTAASFKTDGRLSPWVTTRSFSGGRDAHGAGLVGDVLWVVGGGTAAAMSDVQVGQLPAVAGLGPFVLGTPVPTARRGQTAVATERHVYLLGGAAAVVFNEVWMAAVLSDGSLGAWVAATPLPAPRFLHAAVLHADRIYVLGGSVAGSPTADVLSAPILADGTLGAWVTSAPFNQSRSEATAAVVGDRLYLLGGQNTTAYADVQVASILPDGGLGPWAPTTPLNRPRWGHATVVYGGRLYVLGGQPDNISTTTYLNDSQSALVLIDGGVGPWSASSSFSMVRRNFSARAENGSVLLFGGVDPLGIRHDDVEAAPLHADGTLGAWSSVARFANGRRHPSTASIAGRIFLCCGVGEPIQTAYNDVQSAQILGPNARGAYSVSLDLGPTAQSIDTVTLSGTLIPGTKLWVTTRTAGATGVFSPPVTVGPVALGTPVSVAQSGRYLRLGLLLDAAAAVHHDPDATNRGTLTSIAVAFTASDAGPVDGGSGDGGSGNGGSGNGGPSDGGSGDDGGPGDGGPGDAGRTDGGAGRPISLTVGCNCSQGSAPGWALCLLVVAARRRRMSRNISATAAMRARGL